VHQIRISAVAPLSNSQANHAAHLGGFLSGVVLGAALAMVPPKQLHRAKFNVPAGLILTGLVIVTWRMARR